MWLGRAALERIRELELALKESVPRDVYTASLARIADLERRVDWQADMLLRRAQTLPLSFSKLQDEKPAEVPPAIPETAFAQAEAIREEGKRWDKSQQEIADAIRAQTGYSVEELARGNGNYA